MKKAKKTQRLRAASAVRKAKRNGAGSPTTEPPVAGQTNADPADRSDWVQRSFRCPPAADDFMAALRVNRKMTFQTQMLALWKGAGAPISDEDLADNRGGTKPSRPSVAASQTAKQNRPAKKHSGIDVLELLRDPRLLKAIAQQANGRAVSPLPGMQVIIVNFANGKVRYPWRAPKQRLAKRLRGMRYQRRRLGQSDPARREGLRCGRARRTDGQPAGRRQAGCAYWGLSSRCLKSAKIVAPTGTPARGAPTSQIPK
jgi:hypothetical protein